MQQRSNLWQPNKIFIIAAPESEFSYVASEGKGDLAIMSIVHYMVTSMRYPMGVAYE